MVQCVLTQCNVNSNAMHYKNVQSVAAIPIFCLSVPQNAFEMLVPSAVSTKLL